MELNKRVAIIGAGISGLAAACHLAKQGHRVTLFEKNNHAGGRIDVFQSDGFTFDMGPSWYWMPEVFEKFYQSFGYTSSDFYSLKRLDPGFEIVFGNEEVFPVAAQEEDIFREFERREKGSSAELKKYLQRAQKIYELAMGKMVYKSFASWQDFLDPQALDPLLLSSLMSTVSKEVRKRFKDPQIRQLLEFPVIFLGATADKIPALYHLMNYAAFVQGTWYPMGGMYKVAEAFEKIARSLGVEIHYKANVQKILVEGEKAYGIRANNEVITADAVLSAVDYAFTEKVLLEEKFRNYKLSYWDKKTFAPSALLFYLGINKELPKLKHHTLFFDTDFNRHINQVYQTNQWPGEPLFYVSTTSKTDPDVAPKGHENVVILVPLSTELTDDQSAIDKIYDNVISRLEKYTGSSIANHVVLKKEVAMDHFSSRYNAYKGNAYGLANTLMQTATLKPKIVNKAVNNLFYSGQLTVPGPGVPPGIISGEIAANLINKRLGDE